MGSVTRLQENVMVQDYHRLLQQSLRGLQCVCSVLFELSTCICCQCSACDEFAPHDCKIVMCGKFEASPNCFWFENS